MKKIDWYILKKFVSTFIFCMLLFTVIAVAVDSSEKTDDFVKSGLTGMQIFRQYYFGYIPFIWSLLYPLFVFIAVIFFTSKMAMKTEIIPILASGTSYNRWLRPYVVGGLLFAVGLWFANRYGIPKANELKNNFESKYLGRFTSGTETRTCVNCFYKRIDSVTYIGIKNYDTATRSASAFFMEQVQHDKVVYNLRAQRIEWDTAKRNWKLTAAVERVIDTMKEVVTQTPFKNINLILRPDELIRDELLKDRLTTPELERFIKREEQRGTEGLNTLRVEQHRRSATPFTVLLLCLIGAMIAGRKLRGGSGLHLATGIGIAAVFILADRFSTVFSIKGDFPPLLAAWVPNIIFSFVALYIYVKAPK